MASFDNLMTIEPWAAFRTPFTDSWFSDVFNRETDTLTKVIQNSLTPQYPPETTTPLQISTGSGRTVSGGSENHTTGSNRKVGVSSGKIVKRKSRASRRNTTTYITADVDNFRQMVQQVTGVGFGGDGQLPVLKPEAHRVGDRLQPGTCCLPTLDTSAFLLDHVTQQNQLVDPTSAILHPPPPNAVVDGGSSGFDFGSFSSFPTLESFQ